MKTLCESIFDVFDDSGDIKMSSRRFLIDEYIKKYCSGNFKYKVLKNDSININGNIKISHDKESFTQLFTINKIINGNITIIKCPKLLSLDGLFELPSSSIDGNLTISDCDSLTHLEGCPEIVNGILTISNNKNLKQLTGAPKEVNGACYIYKNGKRFKDDYVHSVIKSKRIVCNTEESMGYDLITESFKIPILNDLDEFLKKNKDLYKYKSFKDLTYNYSWGTLKWDKIDMSYIDVEHCTSSNINKIKQRVRSAIRYDNEFVIVRNDDIFTAFGKGKEWCFPWIKMTLSRAQWGWDTSGDIRGMKETDIIDYVFTSSEIGKPTEFYFIPIADYKSDIHTSNLRWNREEARRGMEYRDEKYNRKIAEENNRRYKQKLTELKARKESGQDKKIIDDYAEILTKIMKANTLFINNPEKYSKYDLKFLNDDMVRLSQHFNSYMDSRTDLLKGSAYSYTNDSIAKYKAEIVKRIMNINDRLLKTFNL